MSSSAAIREREEIPPGILVDPAKNGIFGDVHEVVRAMVNPRRYPPPPPPMSDAEIDSKASEAVRRGYR